MGHIRYLAIVARDPDALAGWYAKTFATSVIAHGPGGDVSLTDGYFHVALLRHEPGGAPQRAALGGSHLGVAVEDVGEVEQRLRALDPEARLEPLVGDGAHGQWCVRDPNGYPVAISTRSFGLSDERRGMPGIRHVAFAIPRTDRVVDFYTGVFGLRELPTSFVRRRQQLGNRFAGDGCINLALHPHPPERGRELGREPRAGLNHFGFLVPDCGAILDGLGLGERAAFQRPANRPYAEYRIHDPEGTAVDISQFKGWEVDVDRWERAG